MLNRLRQGHWLLLHRIFGLPDRDHTTPYWRSHPPVPAHHHPTLRPERRLDAQRERELQRQPQILIRWQHFVGRLFFRAGSDPRADA